MDPRIKEIAALLRAQFGSRMRRILFFGSRARGDASPESDFDCLLIFDRIASEDKEQLEQISSRLLLDKGVVFAWVAVSQADIERLRYEPFLQNAQREGIAA